MDESDYSMTSAILSQPSEIARAVDDNMDAIISLSSGLRSNHSGRIFIVGTGSSYHSARLASGFFKNSMVAHSTPEVIPLSSYSFVTDTPVIGKNDVLVVVSHRGYKNFSNKSLKIGRRSGSKVVTVTGFDSTIGEGDADIVLRTCKQEKSSAHTVSLTTGLALLLAVSIATSSPEESAVQEVRSVIQKLSSEMRTVLSSTKNLRRIILEAPTPRRVWISGTMQNKIVAQEGALKIQETSYLDAYGFETEQMIHGPLRSASLGEDLFVPILWGSVRDRDSELVSALQHAGCRIITVSDRAEELYNCLDIDFKSSDMLAPFYTLPPIQLLALHLAMKRGTNPDSFRNDDPGFAKLDQKLKL